jgi:hypothetical protein
VSFTIDSVGTIDRDDSQVVFFGTIRCSTAPFAVFDVTVRHGAQQSSFPGFAFCDPDGEAYAVDGFVERNTETGPYAAQVKVHVDAYDPVGDSTSTADLRRCVSFRPIAPV